MNRLRRHIASWFRPGVPLLLALGLLLLSLPAGAAEVRHLRLLHVNDVYEIAPVDGKGGFAELMTLLAAERARGPSLTTLGGDMISPSLMSGVTKGTQMIELANAIGLDAAVLGNHEFDFGPEVLRRRIAESKFAWLATNVMEADGSPFDKAEAYVLREVGGLKVGLLGLVTPETEHMSSPGDGVRFASVQGTAGATVDALRAAGADVVIALTHLTIEDDRALAKAVPGIDLILGGHDHDPISWYEGGVLILKAGSDAHYLGVVDLAIEAVVDGNGESKRRIVPSWSLRSTAGVAPDPAIAALVARHTAAFDAEMDQPLVAATGEIDSRRDSVRTGEASMGSLIADALRSLGADVGMTNGGGIRGDRVYPAGTMLTRKDILRELPFGNYALTLSLAGADLLAALESGVSQVEDKAGRFPQVSGLSFAYDPSRPPGSRVLSVEVGGAPLDPARVYTVATTDYLARGGDGYAPLANGRVLVDTAGAPLLASLVMEYLLKQGQAAPPPDGRISIEP